MDNLARKIITLATARLFFDFTALLPPSKIPAVFARSPKSLRNRITTQSDRLVVIFLD
jgi:hypothetical protein